METAEKTIITVQTIVNAPIEKAWKYFNEPEHIKQWAFASDDWHAPKSENDVRTGGKFKTTMAAKDGSFSFDFAGTYTKVEPMRLIEYVMDDGRKCKIAFEVQGKHTIVTEAFEAEGQNPTDMQRDGWQAILNNYKKHTEKE
ncbi:MAG TPA: SRPBCC domain-containing protein [Chryseolinea sp.]|nr:SRPBCC domain-containing protein [Chryseolinea sp.]